MKSDNERIKRVIVPLRLEKVKNINSNPKVIKEYWKFKSLPSVNFWDFLNISFGEQIKYLAQWILRSHITREIIYSDEIESIVPIKIYDIDTVDFTKATFEYIEDVYRREGKRPTHLLLGRDIWEKLYNEQVLYSSFVFELPYTLNATNIDIGSLFNLKVIVVAHMEGAIAVNLEYFL